MCRSFPFSFAPLSIVRFSVLAQALKPLLHRAEEEKLEVGIVCLLQNMHLEPLEEVIINPGIFVAIIGNPLLTDETLGEYSSIYNY